MYAISRPLSNAHIYLSRMLHCWPSNRRYAEMFFSLFAPIWYN